MHTWKGAETWIHGSLTECVVDLEVVVRLGGVGRPLPVGAIDDDELAPRAAARREEHEEEGHISDHTAK